MIKFLAILLSSFGFSFSLAIPFINALYNLKFRNPKVKSEDMFGEKTIFNKLHGHKVGTPTGGGILIIGSAILFSLIFYALTKFTFNWTSAILFFTFIGFGLLGLYDDCLKFFQPKQKGFWGLRIRYKFLLQWVLAFIVGYLLYSKMNLHQFSLPLLNGFDLGLFYIPFAALVIVATSNAFNITDGLDGLASGLLIISLLAFWYLAGFSNFNGDITLLISVLVGALIAFLYFNIYPARLFMGDTGALGLGAGLGVIALMTNQAFALIFIGGIFVIEASSSLIQWGSMIFLHGKKIFKIAPLHHHCEALGWPETKVTMRFWLAGAVLGFIGILIGLL